MEPPIKFCKDEKFDYGQISDINSFFDDDEETAKVYAIGYDECIPRITAVQQNTISDAKILRSLALSYLQSVPGIPSYLTVLH